MRTSAISTIIISAVALGASASSLLPRVDTYPTCALVCVASPDLGGCVAVTDTRCLCTNDTFISTTTKCIQNACSGSDLENALAFSRELCAKVGVTLTSAAASSTASPGSSSSSSSGSASASAPSSSSPSSAATSSHEVNTLLGLVAAGLTVFAL